ncbi:MAG: hypothetical protein J3Q66DRAFT_363494 [Benniella sp.]|nr:MAG: hypothetical protein J3Q66DRAFT_363494 [Benniella sp.]
MAGRRTKLHFAPAGGLKIRVERVSFDQLSLKFATPLSITSPRATSRASSRASRPSLTPTLSRKNKSGQVEDPPAVQVHQGTGRIQGRACQTPSSSAVTGCDVDLVEDPETAD